MEEFVLAANSENCKIVFDTLHFVSSDTIHHYKIMHRVIVDTIHSYDTTHVSLDSVASLEAVKNAHAFYNALYVNAQNDMSNIIAVFAVIIGIMTIVFGGNFLWQNGIGIRFYKHYKNEMMKSTEETMLEFKKTMILAHIRLGNQLFDKTKKPSTDSLYQFYLALNLVVLQKYKPDLSDLCKEIFAGIMQNYLAIEVSMTDALVDLLSRLSENIGNQDDSLCDYIDALCRRIKPKENMEGGLSLKNATNQQNNPLEGAGRTDAECEDSLTLIKKSKNAKDNSGKDLCVERSSVETAEPRTQIEQQEQQMGEILEESCENDSAKTLVQNSFKKEQCNPKEEMIRESEDSSNDKLPDTNDESPDANNIPPDTNCGDDEGEKNN